jgi:hypothetical protein
MVFNNIQVDLSSIRDRRQKLWRCGYRPVPINNGLKFPWQKHWTDLARLDPPWACVNVSQYRTGTGILCDGLRAIDVDLDDPILAKAMCDYIEQIYGVAPFRWRRGCPRRVYLFRADQGEPRKCYVVNDSGPKPHPRVEILGKGNQFFAFGIHPDSGEPLRWSDSPETIHRDDLPALTDDQTHAIMEFARNLIGATRKVYRSNDEPMPVRTATGKEWPIGDIVSALDAIPNSGTDYEWWFKIASATHHAANGSQEGYYAFAAWSWQCRPRSNSADRLWRSLSESPAYYTAGTLVVEARSYDPSWNRPSMITPINDFYGRTLHGAKSKSRPCD